MNHLLDSRVVVSGIRCFQFKRDQLAADLLLDDLRDGLGVVRSR